MDYQIVSDEYLAGVIAGVKEMISEGYKPLGGIAVLHTTWRNERKGYDENETWFYQAMVKDEA